MLIPFLNMNVCATPHAPSPHPTEDVITCIQYGVSACLHIGWYNQETMQYIYQNTLITAVLYFCCTLLLLYFTLQKLIQYWSDGLALCGFILNGMWLTCSDHFPIRLGPLCVLVTIWLLWPRDGIHWHCPIPSWQWCKWIGTHGKESTSLLPGHLAVMVMVMVVV